MKSSTENQNALIMVQTANQLIEMIQKRLNNRIEALNALSSSPMDNSPDEIKKMREIEASKIRAVLQEQKDLIEIIRMLFPDIKPATNEQRTGLGVGRTGTKERKPRVRKQD